MIWEGLEGHISYFKVLLKNDIIWALKISKIHDTYLYVGMLMYFLANYSITEKRLKF